MDFDIRAAVGLIGIVSAAAMLGMSYIGAFQLGRARGRREVEQELQNGFRSVDDGQADRLIMIESAVTSMAQAVERLTDAQRIALLEQLRVSSQETRRSRRFPGQNTPA